MASDTPIPVDDEDDEDDEDGSLEDDDGVDESDGDRLVEKDEDGEDGEDGSSEDDDGVELDGDRLVENDEAVSGSDEEPPAKRARRVSSPLIPRTRLQPKLFKGKGPTRKK